MDFVTIIGLVGVVVVIVAGISIGSSITIFIDIPSVLIVGIGTFFATSTSYSGKDIINSFRVVKNAFFSRSKSLKDVARMLIEMSIRARKEGLLALESLTEDIRDPFLAKGIQLVVDGHEVEDVDKIMSAEIESIEERHDKGASIFSTLGTYSPALGLIGTLIGLVQMLQNMDDPSRIGPAMAVALLTTFYGAILANVVFHPLAGKLGLRSKEEVASKSMILSGILAISNGDNPRIVEQKINAYLTPQQQVSFFESE